MVPVLSSTIVSTLWVNSRLSASLIRIPCSAPLPTPTIMAVGVARPSAQGQAMTSTVTKASIPWVKPSVPPHIHHIVRANKAIAITTGTNMAAMRSTSFCTGALLPWAVCTILMICDNMVSAPTWSARKRKLPFWFRVPAKTASFTVLATATGSPLSMLSST
ncbi:hypothetical protein D3C86_1666370 [compost metagenome]